MKTFIQILIGLAILFGMYWVLSTAFGFLVWGGIAAAIGGSAFLLFKRIQKKRLVGESPASLAQKDAESEAKRLLDEMDQLLKKT